MAHKRKDRDAMIVIAIIIVICAVTFPYIGDIMQGDSKRTDLVSTLLKEKRYAEKRRNGEYSSSDKSKDESGSYYAVPKKETELFAFDPNTADSTALLRLGLRPWQVRNIYRYRAAGGYYRKPSDFARLYGLTAEQYERLLPYIKIAPQRMAADVYDKNENYNYNENGNKNRSVRSSSDASLYKESKNSSLPTGDSGERGSLYPHKIKSGEQININTADTTLLKRIPGIGSYFAMRIVKKRDQLGGFYSVNQLREIENFPLTSLPFMNVGSTNATTSQPEALKLIRINHLNVRELSRHPYIRYAQAKQIDDYKRMSGTFKSANELNKLPAFSPDDVAKLAPYLRFD